MMKRIACLCSLLFTVIFLHAQKQPLPIIFDTDMGPDYDDVGAIAILHDFTNKGQAKILATMASTKYEGVAAVLNVLNTYFKRPGIPIGVPTGKAITQRDFQHWTDTLIANYPHVIKRNSDAPDAVSLYRKILAKQPDNSVTIVTVGFLTNISNLLQSPPDKYSRLDGRALVKQKVNRLVCMAGAFPAGSEFNIREDAAASQYVFEHFEKEILFSGVEIGRKIKTGIPLIQNDDLKNSPVKDAFRIAIPKAKEDSAGRSSWDETAVYIAIAGHAPFYKLVSGTIRVAADGSNTWDANGRNHFYIIENSSPSEMQKVINELIMH